ncbi:glycosyltransferase family 4 protein [Corynebacterium coyleae]|uniref:glycosyltransferase family 4 protein n=1 Tax=Corynebacterium coyleae TaxID=53374 RepID=UPI00254CCB22|nr:glycosyltransferase family 4 protein [Corynebacterium coyleae]MDK8823360.1 glycosyltransferase family 4 protein [Corynebacterium coyleae]
MSAADKVKQVCFMVSFSLRQIQVDPEKFANDFRRRFASIPGLGQLLSMASCRYEDAAYAEASRLFEQGEFTQALHELPRRPWLKTRRSAYEFETQKLRQVIEPSVPLHRAERVTHYLTNSLPHSVAGYSLRSHSVLQGMSAQGIEVEGVTRAGYPNVVGKVAADIAETVDGITYRRILPRVTCVAPECLQEAAVKDLASYARDFGADALHTTTGFENALIVSRAAKALGIPWVYEMRGAPEQTWLSKRPEAEQRQAKQSEYYRLAQQQELEACKQAAAVVVLSEVTKRQLEDSGVNPNKIVVVPNGIDDRAFEENGSQSQLRELFHLPVEKTIVGAITSVVDYEGLEYFVQAFKYLDEEFAGVVVGDGAALAELRVLADSLGVADRVSFVGKQPASTIGRWYQCLDVFVVPRKDTLVCRNVTPLKALNAQALGIPVVASDLPALREVTGEIETYVQPENAERLARGIMQAVGRDGLPSIEWAKTRQWSRLANKYRELYLGAAW